MLNSIILMGRLTKTPELKSTEQGTAVTTFSIAVDRRFASADGTRETDFFNVVAWSNTAVFVADHFSKGEMICIRGELRNRKYTDKNGSKHTVNEVLAEEVSFC